MAAGHDEVRRDNRGQEGPLEPRRLQAHPVSLDDPGTTRDRLVQLFLAALRDPELGLSAKQLEAAPKVAARLYRAGAIA